jgi:hypothetical protein
MLSPIVFTDYIGVLEILYYYSALRMAFKLSASIDERSQPDKEAR